MKAPQHVDSPIRSAKEQRELDRQNQEKAQKIFKQKLNSSRDMT